MSRHNRKHNGGYEQATQDQRRNTGRTTQNQNQFDSSWERRQGQDHYRTPTQYFDAFADDMRGPASSTDLESEDSVNYGTQRSGRQGESGYRRDGDSPSRSYGDTYARPGSDRRSWEDPEWDRDRAQRTSGGSTSDREGNWGQRSSQGQRSGQGSSWNSQSEYDMRDTGMPTRGSAPRSYKRSDERLTEDVCETLMDRGLDCSRVDVSVKGGVVTLSGDVSDRSDRLRMEQIAAGVSGVTDVENHLRLSKATGIDAAATTGTTQSKSSNK